MDRKTIDLKDCKALLCKALKEAFPGVTFAVRMRRGRSTALKVEWTDGPAVAQVEGITDAFVGSYFDGLTDLAGSRYHELDGQPVRLDSDRVELLRNYSEAATLRAIDRVFSKHAEALSGAGIERPSLAEFQSGALLRCTLPAALRDDDNLQRLIRRAMVRHTDRARVQRSATHERLRLIGDDGHRQDTEAAEAHRQARCAAKAAPAPITVPAVPFLATSATVYPFKAPEQLQ